MTVTQAERDAALEALRNSHNDDVRAAALRVLDRYLVEMQRRAARVLVLAEELERKS